MCDEPLGHAGPGVAARGDDAVGELRRQVSGVSEKMLAQTLQTLEKDGFVHRYARPVIPPHVEYSLTSLGAEVAVHVEGLTDWIEENVGRVLKARERKPRTRS